MFQGNSCFKQQKSRFAAKRLWFIFGLLPAVAAV